MAQTINLGHVKGDKGDQGIQGIQGVQGIQGPQGPAGPGCPTGGTTGQVLMKASGTDYDYNWSNIQYSTLREVPVSVPTTAWTLSNGVYTAEITTAYVTTTSKEKLTWKKSYWDYTVDGVDAKKKSGGGGVVLTTSTVPTGTLTGTLSIIDTDDGKIPVIIEDTVVAIANGGTGAANLSGAKANLEIPEVVDNLTTNDQTKALSAKQGKILSDQMANMAQSFKGSSPNGKTITITVATSKSILVVLSGESVSRSAVLLCSVSNNASYMSVGEIYKGGSTTVTSNNNVLTITFNAYDVLSYNIFVLNGTSSDVSVSVS